MSSGAGEGEAGSAASTCSGSSIMAGEGAGAGGAKAGEGIGEKRASLIGSTWSGAEMACSVFGGVGARLLTPPRSRHSPYR
eukprot:3204656-Prymnesium_polylepis.1